MTLDVGAVFSKEFTLYQAVRAADRFVKALRYALGFGAAHEAIFVNRAGVLAFRVLSAPVQIDLPQSSVQISADGLGVANEVKAVTTRYDGLHLLVLSAGNLRSSDGVMSFGIQTSFSARISV